MRTQSWLLSYGLIGLTRNGLVPVLMPLAARSAGAAGLTYAAFPVPGLFAPFLGTWADHTRRHRDLLIGGSIGAGILLLLFCPASEPLRILLAAGAGLGVMATTTAGNVLAIQDVAQDQWDTRVAVLQRFVSACQVIGLVIAGVFRVVAGPPVGRDTCASVWVAWSDAPGRSVSRPIPQPAQRAASA